MENKHDHQLLNDPDNMPCDELLKRILESRLYSIMKSVEQIIIDAGLNLEWRYYKDGKAWLGKVTYKKKTQVWLSVWEEYIKAGFYFTEKNRSGIFGLDLSENVKSSFTAANSIGKLIPLVVEVKNENSLKDFSMVLDYKKGLS